MSGVNDIRRTEVERVGNGSKRPVTVKSGVSRLIRFLFHLVYAALLTYVSLPSRHVTPYLVPFRSGDEPQARRRRRNG